MPMCMILIDSFLLLFNFLQHSPFHGHLGRSEVWVIIYNIVLSIFVDGSEVETIFFQIHI